MLGFHAVAIVLCLEATCDEVTCYVLEVLKHGNLQQIDKFSTVSKAIFGVEASKLEIS